MTCGVHFKATDSKIQHRWDDTFKILTIFPDASNFSFLFCFAVHIHMNCLGKEKKAFIASRKASSL